MYIKYKYKYIKMNKYFYCVRIYMYALRKESLYFKLYIVFAERYIVKRATCCIIVTV